MTLRTLFVFSLFWAVSLLAPQAAAATGCPKAFQIDETRIFHSSPKSRLVGSKHVSGHTCLSFVKPEVASRAGGRMRLMCPIGYQNERVGILHDAPKQRLLNDTNSVHWSEKEMWTDNFSPRRTCIAVVKPDAAIAGRNWVLAGSHDRIVYIRGAAVSSAGPKFQHLYSVPAVSLGVCSVVCNDNQRCVAFNYRVVSKQCEVFTQWDYRGDAVAYPPVAKLAYSSTSTVGIRVGSATSFFGKIDYSALYSKSSGLCPADSEYTLSGSESSSAGAPAATSSDPPLSCIYDSRCAVEVNANNGKPVRRYVKVPTSKAANGSYCSFRRLHRPPRSSKPGAG